MTPVERPLELWAGLEATVNRVGDRFRDQLELTGHARRLDDLDRLARLGATAVRYPVLWERTAPDGPDRADWAWPDERLAGLRARGLRPIVGLVHHGSGPRGTDLLDPHFPEKLAEYAGAVARRYPWVDAYTPVNEPLTTARFSALYGHWYPHRRDGLAFAQAVMTQCRATVLAMRAIRAVNPDARLIQTEDLGRTWSTPALAYQADFENERRWLSFDLLHGRLDRDGPVWSYLRWLGVDEYALRWFEDNPCPPDVLGINTYMTSERFLDERVGRYPPATHGGNMRDAYADVEAVRVRAEGLAGARALLGQTWARYRRPVAITEAHLGCTREEQLRWLLEIWEAARAARADGADVRAVTVWSVFGAVDWDSLLTLDRRSYEPGVFDLRAPEPRPTALAGLARSLARGEAPTHPVLAAPGWWRRPVRFAYGFAVREDGGIGPVPEEVPMRAQTEHGRPLLITGATGTLGRAFARLCELRGLPYRLTRRADMDIADPASVAARLDADRPWAAINAAGYVRVDDAERERDACFRENTDGPAILAAACAARGIALVTFSSDLVFDGTKGAPYVEGDPPNPLNVYGESKAAAERRVLAADPSALVIRTSAFFGPWDAYNFVTIALRTLAEGRPFEAASDGVVSPTYVPDLVHATLDLLVDGERGIWHLANRGSTTWADLARLAAERAGLPADLVKGRPTAEFGWPARRPTNTTLASERADIMPSLEHALERFLRDSEDRWLARAAPSPGAPPTVQSSAVG